MTTINIDKFISNNIMLYIYISRRISRKTKYESNGKVDGKLAQRDPSHLFLPYG